jgi:antagonist of KipI
MGSRSCYAGAALGGHEGRPLQAGDVLRRGPGDSVFRPWRLPAERIPVYPSDITLRAVAGPQDDYFDSGLELFFNAAFTVSPQANRMGYRLTGPVIEQIEGLPRSIISEPSLPGGVQIPQDGQPIVLLLEQTVGGYTKIATVISSDIAKVAQARPGDTIRFSRVDIAAAHDACRAQAALLERIRSEACSPVGAAATVAAVPDWGSEEMADRLRRHLCQI